MCLFEEFFGKHGWEFLLLYTLLPCEIKVKGFDNNVNWKMKFGKNENKDLNIKIAKHESSHMIA